jgi:hypothetical protein
LRAFGFRCKGQVCGKEMAQICERIVQICDKEIVSISRSGVVALNLLVNSKSVVEFAVNHRKRKTAD